MIVFVEEEMAIRDAFDEDIQRLFYRKVFGFVIVEFVIRKGFLLALSSQGVLDNRNRVVTGFL